MRRPKRIRKPVRISEHLRHFYAVAPKESGEGSSCNKACEVFVIPCGDLSLETEGVLSLCLLHQVEGDVLDGGEVGWCVVVSQAALVVAKDHVHDPVQAVLHRPVVADAGTDPVGRQGQRGNVEAGLALAPADPTAQFAAALEHDDSAQPGPVVAFTKPGHIVEDDDIAGLDAPVIAIDRGAAADGCVVETIGLLLGGEDHRQGS